GRGAVLRAESPRGPTWWAVPVAVFAVYWPCLFAGLVYDDWVNFDRNQPLRDGDWFALVTQPYYGPDTTYWRPITSLLMGLAYQAGPCGVHLLAIVLHVLAAYAVAAIARQLLGDARLALFAALLFALHPLQVESVAWASALPGVPSGLFLLLATRSVSSWANGSGRRLPWSAAAWLSCCLLAKESGVVALPLLAIVVSTAGGSRPRSAKFAVVGAVALVGAAWFAVHAAMVGWRPVLGDDGPWIAGAAQMTVRAVVLLFWPWPLTPFRAHPHAIGSASLDVVAVVVVAAGAVAAIVAWRRLAVRWRIAGALAVLPLLLSAVTYDAVGPHPLTDRYLYSAVGGFALLVTASIGRHFVALATLVAVCGASAFVQCHVWQDDSTFVAHVLELTPGDQSVHVLAGTNALRAGDATGLRRARCEFRAAIHLQPRVLDAFDRRQLAAALAGLAWCEVIDSDRGADRARCALAGRFRQALELDPLYVPAWVGLGVARGMSGQFEAALDAFARALAIDPLCPEAWFNLGRTQVDMGRRADARHSLRRALQCAPGLAAAAALMNELDVHDVAAARR
ncbi:MAG TPA: tetratricopeptide repeat protein, partial [Planctomycetota bacterium]|nr:tetratricopeptide repeat protein [Planctomycetota bacterium]